MIKIENVHFQVSSFKITALFDNIYFRDFFLVQVSRLQELLCTHIGVFIVSI